MEYPLFSVTRIAHIICAVVLIGTDAKVTDLEYGKMPPVFRQDDYDQCMLLGKEANKALFCSVTMELSPEDSENSTTTTWHTIQEVSKDENNFKHSILRHGICIKESCPEIPEEVLDYTRNLHILTEEISKCYTKKYKDRGLKAHVQKIQCQIGEREIQLNIYEKIAIYFFIGYFCLLLLGTAYEGIARCNTEEEYNARTKYSRFGEFISCFSIIVHWKRLTNSSRTGVLQCIEGIRCMTMFMIIGCHCGLLQIVIGVSNTQYTEMMIQQPKILMTLNIFACQSFFLISCFLLTNSFYKAFDKGDMQPDYIIKYLAHRYLRLMPCLVALTLFLLATYTCFASSPYYYTLLEKQVQHCRDNWWTNMLLINNYYNVDHMCFLHTWYIATDSHLFVFALILLTLMMRFKSLVKLLLGVSLMVALLLPMIEAYAFGYNVIPRLYPEHLSNMLVGDPFFKYMYFPTHTNLGGGVFGVIFGYVYYKTEGQKLLTTRIHVAMWYAAILLPNLIISYLTVYFIDDPNGYPFLSAVHAGLARNMFAFSIGLLILGISQGHGWFLRDLLNWKPFQVLGKLCYCAYLVHPIYQSYRIVPTRSPTLMHPFASIVQAVSDIAPSFFFGTIMYLTIEMPFWSLQKLYLPQVENVKITELKLEGGKQKAL